MFRDDFHPAELPTLYYKIYICVCLLHMSAWHFTPFQGIKLSHFICKTKHIQDINLEGPPSEMNKLSITRAARVWIGLCSVQQLAIRQVLHPDCQLFIRDILHAILKNDERSSISFGLLLWGLSHCCYPSEGTNWLRKSKGVWLRKLGFDCTISIGTT